MKNLLWIFFLILFAGLNYLSEAIQIPWEKANVQKPEYYSNGIVKKELDNLILTSNYKIKAELFPDLKKIKAELELVWINHSEFSTNIIQLHLYPNGLKNNKTLFAAGRNLKLTGETKSGIFFEQILLNGQPVNLEYIQPEIKNEYDSTVAQIKLPTPANSGDTVRLKFVYSTPIPKAGKRFGYAAGRNFFFISQWFPKAGVYSQTTKGKWITSQYHPYTNYFSDFGHYEVEITVPENYIVAAAGVITDSIKIEGKIKYNYTQTGIHDFAWMATDEIIQHTEVYRQKDNSEVSVLAYIQPENKKYTKRIIEAVKKSLLFFEGYIESYPYQSITIVDAPKTSQSGGMEYPTLITVGANLFSPAESLQPESVTIHEFVHQYFYGILANNEVYEAWLDEGLTNYLEGKILREYYGDELISFKLLGYYPIFGLNFLSYNEIPLIYSLGEFIYPEGASSLSAYYRNPVLFAITDTSYLHPDINSYLINAYSKPELALLSLERYLGFEKVMKILKDFYRKYKFSHPTGNDLLKIIQKNSNEDLSWFFDNLFYGTSLFDYSIRSIIPTGKEDEYEVFIERMGDGVFKQEISFYTDKDTLYQQWDGNGRWKKLLFYSQNKVVGAEIDPERKNILDINYTNNSYVINSQYGGSLGLTLRWFFWMQNLLLILGSVA